MEQYICFIFIRITGNSKKISRFSKILIFGLNHFLVEKKKLLDFFRPIFFSIIFFRPTIFRSFFFFRNTKLLNLICFRFKSPTARCMPIVYHKLVSVVFGESLKMVFFLPSLPKSMDSAGHAL